mgnify:CR=1 FL=1
MSTHYIENENSNQYYFDAGNASPATVTTSIGSSEYSPYPAGVSGARTQYQQVRSERTTYNDNDSYQLPQQHQSVAGFNKTTSQQQYQSSAPQVKATVRTVNTQEQQHGSSQYYQQPQQSYTSYEQQNSPQQQQYQYDSRQQSGQVSQSPGYYQSPNTTQYSQYEVHQRTESPSQGRDQHAQVFRKSVFFYPQIVVVTLSTFMC